MESMATRGKEYEKTENALANLTENNIARIREMFPGCVTEAHIGLIIP
ncbi:hypothetical protein [Advenella sp.]|nr:hypothetical protein [Advenella sp.]